MPSGFKHSVPYVPNVGARFPITIYRNDRDDLFRTYGLLSPGDEFCHIKKSWAADLGLVPINIYGSAVIFKMTPVYIEDGDITMYFGVDFCEMADDSPEAIILGMPFCSRFVITFNGHSDKVVLTY